GAWEENRARANERQGFFANNRSRAGLLLYRIETNATAAGETPKCRGKQGPRKQNALPVNRKGVQHFRSMRSEDLVFLLRRAFEGRAEDVAQRRAGVGRTVLFDCFLLVADFHRLDRQRDLAGRLVERRHQRVDLVADSK